jgi:hypothetical protein
MITVHAGGYSFVPSVLLIYESRQETGNYNNEMDRNCVHWLKHDSKFATQFGTNY